MSPYRRLAGRLAAVLDATLAEAAAALRAEVVAAAPALDPVLSVDSGTGRAAVAALGPAARRRELGSPTQGPDPVLAPAAVALAATLPARLQTRLAQEIAHGD